MNSKHVYGWIAAVCVLAFMAGPAAAQDGRFVDSAEEIVRELSRETPKSDDAGHAGQPQTRGLTRGYSPADAAPDPRKRAIVVREKQVDQDIEKTIMVSETDLAPRVNLTIQFDYDSYAIRPGSYPLLDELGRALGDAALAGKPVMIIGHADGDGPDVYNLTLSANRAMAVKHYLMGRFSIPAHRVRAVGFGKAMPIAPNDTPANKQKNRRVEVRLDQGVW